MTTSNGNDEQDNEEPINGWHIVIVTGIIGILFPPLWLFITLPGLVVCTIATIANLFRK